MPDRRLVCGYATCSSGFDVTVFEKGEAVGGQKRACKNWLNLFGMKCSASPDATLQIIWNVNCWNRCTICSLITGMSAAPQSMRRCSTALSMQECGLEMKSPVTWVTGQAGALSREVTGVLCRIFPGKTYKLLHTDYLKTFILQTINYSRKRFHGGTAIGPFTPQ